MCDRCDELEDELKEAESRIEELENDVDEWESQYYDVDSEADQYMAVSQSLVTLIRQIGKEIPHIYMLLETPTFNEMKEWLKDDSIES